MLRGLLFRTWLVTLIASFLLIALVFFLGQMVWEPLGGGSPFWIVGVMILAAWTTYNGLRYWRGRRRDKALIQGIAAGEDPSSAEVRLLRERLEQCLKRIKATAGAEGSRRLSELPWYILIGPPGAGKTTALAKSGLRFIGATGRDIEAVSGVGGTRNCDWFFTEQAVLLDTAGRFTTQDSDQKGDGATWLGFLDLLKTHRPRQPVNGAIIATSLPDLAALSEAARRQQGQTIRDRLAELRSRLGVDLPVYLLLTKLDRINGFIEFFGELHKEERRQVWGFTLPAPTSRSDDREIAVQEAKLATGELLACLAGRMISRVYEAPDPVRRGLIFNFPYQMAALRPTIEELLDEVFGPSRFDRPALLRGVYFTSGVQEGAPIDRVMAVLSRAFCLSAGAPRAAGATGRSFFLADLLDRVIFPEAGLVGLDPVVERRRKIIRVGAFTGIGIVAIALLSLWSVSAMTNLAQIQNTEAQIPDYRQTVEPVLKQAATSSDLVPILPALAKLRAFSGIGSPSAPKLAGFGLYQGENIADGGKIAYRRGLNAMLLPCLVSRLTELVSRSGDDPGKQYEYLKALLMLAGGYAPVLDSGFIERVFDEIWRDDGAPVELAVQQKLHLAALLDGRTDTVPVDQRVVRAARDHLAQKTAAVRAYEAIKNSPEVKALKDDWILIDHAGPTADQALVLRSNRSLADATIPALFTHEGFERALLAGTRHASDTIMDDPWVLGNKSSAVLTDQLTRNVVQLYEDEFIQVWDRLLDDLAVKKIYTVDDAIRVLNILGSPASPLVTLIPDIVKETELTRTSEENKVLNDIAPGKMAPIQRLETRVEKVATDAGENFHPGATVQAHYAKLAQYAGNGNGSSQLASVIRNLAQAGEELQRLSAPGQDASLSKALASANSLHQLKTQAESGMPRPLGTLVASIGEAAASLAPTGARNQLKGDWNGFILPSCKTIVEGRYPFQRDDTGPGVPLEDFANLLGPNGTIAAYFNQNLKSLVDTSGAVWRWQSGGGANVGLNPDTLTQMQRAAKIRTVFFQGGNGQLGFSVVITPRELDRGVRSADLTIDDQSISYSFGPQQPTRIQWPGPSGLGQIRLALIPEDGGPTPTITATGPWAWYRFVDQGRVEQSPSGGALRLTFNVSGRRVSYDISGSSLFTPLTSQDLISFHCSPL